MILKKKETAEQKLLKMIEASSSEGSASLKTKQKVASKQDLLSVLKTVNKLLYVGVAVVIVLVGLEIKSGMELLGKDINLSASQDQGSLSTKSGLLPTVQKLPYYLAGVNRRNIFRPYEPDAIMAKTRQPDQMNINRKTKGFKLVGISWMDRVDTASAMIEDKDKQITYFLQMGENIGNVKINKIYADSVELVYENEEMILRYEKTQM